MNQLLFTIIITIVKALVQCGDLLFLFLFILVFQYVFLYESLVFLVKIGLCILAEHKQFGLFFIAEPINHIVEIFFDRFVLDFFEDLIFG